MPSLTIIYASTSGHTEFVVDTLIAALGKKVSAQKIRAERAQPADFMKGDVLLLACGTWNTGGVEGQLNPHMHMLLRERAKDVDLTKKKVAVIGLGDKRYRYTAKAHERLMEFVTAHGGTLVADLKIVNEPYEQEAAVQTWAKTLLSSIK